MSEKEKPNMAQLPQTWMWGLHCRTAEPQRLR